MKVYLVIDYQKKKKKRDICCIGERERELNENFNNIFVTKNYIRGKIF